MSYPPNDPQQPWQHGNPQSQQPQQPPQYGQQPEQPQQPPAEPPQYGQPYQPQQQYPQQPPQQPYPQQPEQPQQPPQQAPQPQHAPQQQYPQTPGAQQPTGPQQPYAPQPDYGSHQTQVYPPQNTEAYPAGMGGGQPPVKKKKSMVGWIAGGSALLLIIIAGVVGISIGNAAHAPENQVTAYLDLLKAGKAEQALKASGVKVEKSDLLLTDDAYKSADDRISKYSISSSEVDGESATVTASISQGGETYDQTFSLSTSGKDLLIFDNWKLDPPDLGEVAYDVTGPENAQVSVNGVAVPADSDALRALPGTYKIGMSEDQTVFQAEGVSTTVLGFGAESEETPELAVTLSDEGVKAAEGAVSTFLDECQAKTEMAPDGCPNTASDRGTKKIEDVVWTFDPMPEYSIGEYSGTGWDVVTDTSGEADVSATVTWPDDTVEKGVKLKQPVEINVDGSVTFGDDGKATFEWDQF